MCHYLISYCAVNAASIKRFEEIVRQQRIDTSESEELEESIDQFPVRKRDAPLINQLGKKSVSVVNVNTKSVKGQHVSISPSQPKTPTIPTSVQSDGRRDTFMSFNDCYQYESPLQAPDLGTWSLQSCAFDEDWNVHWPGPDPSYDSATPSNFQSPGQSYPQSHPCNNSQMSTNVQSPGTSYLQSTLNSRGKASPQQISPSSYPSYDSQMSTNVQSPGPSYLQSPLSSKGKACQQQNSPPSFEPPVSSNHQLKGLQEENNRLRAALQQLRNQTCTASKHI